MTYRARKFNQTDAFTLVEMVVCMFLLGLITAVVLPRAVELIDQAQISATEKELIEIQRAIIGDPATGLMGFRDTVQRLPTGGEAVGILHTNSSGIAAYDSYTGIGWNGPYVDSSSMDGDGTADIEQDAWGNAYVYNAAGTVTSLGKDGAAGGSGVDADIVVNLN